MTLRITAESPVSDSGRSLIAGSQVALMAVCEPDEIFTMTDELLVHTHYLLSRRGKRIPEDVSLLAISDGQAPSFLHPNVTHLRHSGVELGERTAHILIGMIEHNSDAMMDVRIRTTLVEMGSVVTRTAPATRRAKR